MKNIRTPKEKNLIIIKSPVFSRVVHIAAFLALLIPSLTMGGSITNPGGGGTTVNDQTCSAGDFFSAFVSPNFTCSTPTGGGSGAPATATYITQVPESGLSAEQALSDLSSGFMKSTTGTGVVTTTPTVNAATELTGNLPVGNLNGGSGASSSTYWRGDGVWATPSGGGGATNVVLGSDVTTNSTTLADVTGMSISVAPSDKLVVTCWMISQTALATTGIQYVWNTPASPTIINMMQITTATTASTGDQITFQDTDDTLGSTTPAAGLPVVNTNSLVMLHTLFVNGSNSGTLQLRMRNETGATVVTAKANSVCRYFTF